MTDTQQKASAKKFADHWKGKGYEKMLTTHSVKNKSTDFWKLTD